MPVFLITNDDGYFSPGIQALREELKKLGRVVTVAPDRNLSGVGHSLTFNMPLRIRRVDEDFWTVIGGTPADCVHLGYYVILEGKKPDLVCSGINEGPNLGEDITYSGTVSGAMEGRILGIPSVAFSAFGRDEVDFRSVAQVCKEVVLKVLQYGMPEDTYLNVNIPNLPPDEIRGFMFTRQGKRAYKEKVLRLLDPQRRPLYWITAEEFGWELEEGTDYWAVYHGYVSITPLQLDLTNHRALRSLQERWRV
ncbi:stationary-phase survival protein SurE [Thermocrinis albus DSM 14484]|uniref:5'-nucleotidase SurE n=1 Tax=Thermocrinis albus (strain DSM 14484 / JCM 11386 / HI 11/12) TaxID=638303 RepID=D3SMY0_THEAH|nr:5'/3'-nucleotidase SurE [Thermocrinis albus]ADC90110.1 stationary-phase survival protein SurE [Thermocrinis albus DSM 14484]